MGKRRGDHSSVMTPELQNKITAARTRLILDKPFLGVLVLRLPLVEAESRWCPTTATDTQSLFYNPEYLAALGTRQLEFVLAHEALHCAFAHFTRREHRDQHRWDLACDFAINPILLEEGLTPPANVVTFMEYAGLTAEEIYPLIEENDEREAMDQHRYGSGRDSNNANEGESTSGAAPPPLSAIEQERVAAEWKVQVANAARQASDAGKLGGSLAQFAESILHPVLPWRAILSRYAVARSRQDYSYSRPSRREGEAIYPRLSGHQIDVAVVLDVSGSIADAELREFIAEVDALKGQMNARVSLFACDTELSVGSPQIFEVWETLSFPAQFPRGGGTSFQPPFIWYESSGATPPDLLIYFTDGTGLFPDHEPQYPVLWLIKGAAPVPWGQRIALN